MKTFTLLITLLLASFTAYSNELIEALDRPGPSQNIRLPLVKPSVEAAVPGAVSRLHQLLTPRLERIRSSRKVYSWEVASPRDRTPHYCISECACLAKELRQELDRLHVRYRLLTIRPNNGLNLKVRDYLGTIQSYTYYHQVLAVFLAGRWRIVDPLILGSTLPERLSVWLQRFPDRRTNIAHTE